MDLNTFKKQATGLLRDVSSAASKAVSSSSDLVQSLSNSAKKVTQDLAEKNEAAKQEKEQKRQREEQIASGFYEENGQTIVSTIGGMQTWLQSLEPDATPSAMQVLQSQLKVLRYVQSPTLTGMAVDNMIVALHDAIQLAEDDNARTDIRKAFAAMFQNYMFFTEATLLLAENNHKQEGLQLLSQAGEMLSETVTQSAQMIVGIRGKLKSAKIAKIIVKNIFAEPETQSNFVKKVIKYHSDKKQLAEKQHRFDVVTEQLFDTFDQYADLIGPSIQIKGMLLRYRKQLVEKRRIAKLQIARKHAAFIDQSKMTNLAEGLAGIIRNGKTDTAALNKTFTAVFGMLGDAANNHRDMDIDAFCMLADAIAKEESDLLQQRTTLLSNLDELKHQYNETSMLKFNLKKEIQQKMDAKQQEISELDTQLTEIRAKQKELKEVFPEAFAIRADLQQYEAYLLSVEQKYEIAV